MRLAMLIARAWEGLHQFWLMLQLQGRAVQQINSLPQWRSRFQQAVSPTFHQSSLVPPMLTRTWFHGAFFEAGKVSQRYAHEYWPGASAMVPDGVLDASLTAEETREAYRVLKGSALRVEVYGADGTERAKSPYKVTEHNFHVRRLQPFGPNQHAVFMTHARESVTRQYERQQDDPRIAHEFTVEVDAFGNVLRSASVAYGRRPPAPSPEPKLSQAFRDMLSYDQSRLH